VRDLKRIKTDTLLDNRYNKLRSIGAGPADELRRKTRPAADRIAAALQAIPTKSTHVPAKV
jgi:hypothetical protein